MPRSLAMFGTQTGRRGVRDDRCDRGSEMLSLAAWDVATMTAGC